MNEHYRAFVDFGRRLADDRGVLWNVRLRDDGMAVPEDAWNITQFVGDVPPPAHWVRNFGMDATTLQSINDKRAHQNLPALDKMPLSPAWQDLLKAVVAEQLFSKQNSTGHVVCNIDRPLRVLATSAIGLEPWELRPDDIVQAIEVAKQIQASGKLADQVLGLVKTLIDANHIADVGPLYPIVSVKRHGTRNKRARHVKSIEELRSDLNARKRAEKLPERRAFWELVRIVFTEKPKSFLDQLRFAQVKVMLLCGLRVGESCLLPSDWKRVREYFDVSGCSASELGGYSKAMMLRYFAEKQQSESSDSIALYEDMQHVPKMFEEILEETLDEVVTLTQPLRNTLRRQLEEKRLLPNYKRDQLVPAVELYPYLTGNPELLALTDDALFRWQSMYRDKFDSSVFDSMLDDQLLKLRSSSHKLSHAVYMYYTRLKGRLTFRQKDGRDWSGSRMKWVDVFVRIDEVEDYLSGITTKLSDQLPYRLFEGGELKAWELMFLMPKRALAEGRNDGLCDVSRYYSVGRIDPDMIHIALGGKDGSGYSLFENYGSSDEDRALTLNSHSLRHLQNTELFRLGVSDTIITKRFNRKSVAQSYVYDHRSLAEELEHIELPVDTQVVLGKNASTVLRMIKAGKAGGSIVKSFKRIQKTQGDDAAFEFLKVEADGFHSTPYGHCINSFTVDPCPKHLECFSGCRHFTATGMPEHQERLIKLEGRLRDAVQLIESRPGNTIGRTNQLIHAKTRLNSVMKVISTPGGQSVFPDGEDLSLRNSKIGGVLNGREK